jgi:pimeloyl-ACP methyl ester carboxylesterase
MYAVITMAVILLGLPALGAAWHALATALERRRLRPPGQLVTVGGSRLHVQCLGAGPGPAVVILTGRGNPALMWQPVVTEVARFAKVITYDRPGYGWSDPLVGAPTAERVVSDLEGVLRYAGARGPYILVGHSMAGLFARLYAARHPADVAGLVLVDARHEVVDAGESAAMRELSRSFYRWALPLERLGLGRLMARLAPGALLGGAGFVQRYPPAVRRTLRAVLAWPGMLAATAAETAHFPEYAVAVRQAPDLGNTPVVVLSRTRPDLGGWGLSKAEVAGTWQLWQEGQAAAARLSANVRHIAVENCGHQMMVEQPDAVVSAIRQVLEMRKPEG